MVLLVCIIIPPLMICCEYICSLSDNDLCLVVLSVDVVVKCFVVTVFHKVD